MKLKINKHPLFILLAATMWGMAGIFVEASKSVRISEMQLVFGRALFTSIIIGGIIIFLDKSLFKIKLKDLWIFGLAGLSSIVLFNYSYYTTMRLSTYSVAAILLYTAPFFVLIFSVFLFKERLNVRKVLSLVIAFSGCCLVSQIFNPSNRISAKALIFGLLTGFGYGLYTIFSNILLKKGYKTFTITFYIFLFAAVFSLPFIDAKNTVICMAITPKALCVVFLMAIFNTVIPYLLYTNGLKGVDASIAPIIATVEPVVATVLGLFYNQRITVSGAFGILLVLSSVVLLNLKTNKVYANAKINLALSVVGKREDGYHTIDTVMQSINLYDTLRFFPCNSIKVIYKKYKIDEQSSLVFKAAKLFFETTGIKDGVKIIVDNNIPMSAGLGGGSADAAATLVGLNRIFSANLSNSKLEEMALKLGADIPFLITGGTKRAEGIGEVLTALPTFEKGYFVLAKGDKKPSTAQMYKRLDSEEIIKPDINALTEALKNDEDIDKYLENSFSVIWEESLVKARLLKFDDCKIFLSGSGPTFVAYFKDKRKAKKAYHQLKRERIEAYFTKPCDNSVIFE